MLIASCLLWLIAILLFVAFWYAARGLGAFGPFIAALGIVVLAIIGFTGKKPLVTVVPCGSKSIATAVFAGTSCPIVKKMDASLIEQRL